MIIINQGRVNYCYKFGEYQPVIKDTVMSNSVFTSVIDSNLSVEKSVDKVSAFLYDTLTYTINIYNISNKKVENIIVKDSVPDGTRFKKNSVKINNQIVYNVFPCNIKIGDLNIGEKAQASFQVFIIKNTYKNDEKIINSAQIDYDFIFNVEIPPVRISICTNKTVTYLKYQIYGCISKTSSLCISLNSLENINIQCINSKVGILKSKILNTITGKKLLLIVRCDYLICYYKSLFNCIAQTYTEEYVDYFSYLLDIPKSVEESEFSSLSIIEENCNYLFLSDESRLIIYNTLIIVDNNNLLDRI